VNTADWRIPLSAKGRRQAGAAGVRVKELLGSDGKVFFYVSPYHRARETLQGVMGQLDRRSVVGVREEPRISEQQFGNFQCVEEVARAKQGAWPPLLWVRSTQCR
jgi:broad specificity phosphatase PhoE